VEQHDNVSYLGMMIRKEKNTGHILIDQHEYLTSFNDNKPATGQLTNRDEYSDRVDNIKIFITSDGLNVTLMPSLCYIRYVAQSTTPDKHMAV
jgi:hypothetical protein